jgi:gliding motility-associated lipoprotein GldK
MRNVILLLTIVFLIGCGKKDKGDLVGVQGQKWNPETPYGMVSITGGSFIMGKSEDDIANINDAPTKTVTVTSFYMDETEITNSEYRQFVEWVKDSIIRTKLAISAAEVGKSAKDKGIGSYAFLEADPAKLSAYEKYMYENYYSIGTTDDPYAARKLDRKKEVIHRTDKYPDAHYAEVMDSLRLPVKEAYNGLRVMNVSKLKFKYSWFDINAAAKAKTGKRSKFLKSENIPVYPDTTAWIKDFAYSYNEPMHNDYFWHQAYSEYPVVGVSWNQARSFCAWRTLYKNAYAKKAKKSLVNSFRLPSEAEWEYSARGGIQSGMYPWGGPYTKNEKGCILANFKPNRGDYAVDGALYTVEAKSYEPNGFGLYNMAGNVAEWTDGAYDSNAYEYVSGMNPSVGDIKNMRKVVRGGSWKDVAYFIQVSTRDFEYADSSRSYIGFRTIRDYMGEKNQNK